MKRSFYFFNKSIIYLIVAAMCINSNTAYALMEFSAPAKMTFDTKPINLFDVEVPKSIGSIKEKFEGRAGKTVFLIQDAHAIPDAQRNIRRLIDYFQKKHGVGIVALEGASSELDSQIFRSFPDQELLKKIFDGYFDRGELTGGVAAAIFNESPSIYHGVENWQLYEEGLRYFLETMKVESQMTAQVDELFNQLQKEKEKSYSVKLLEIDQAMRGFQQNKSDIVSVLEKLSAIKQPQAGSEVALLLEEVGNSKDNDASIEVEVKVIANQVRKALSAQRTDAGVQKDYAEFNQRFQEFRTSRMTPESFALFLKEVSIKNKIKITVSKRLNYLVGHQKRLKDIEGTKLFDEFKNYSQSVKEILFENNEQRSLDVQNHLLELVQRLGKLELSREDWDELKSVLNKMDSWDISQDGVDRQSYTGKLLGQMKAHINFYHNAEKRDQVLLQQAERLFQKYAAKSVTLVAGGFHAQGLTYQLKAKGISYVLLMPEVKAMPDENNYRNHMEGKVTWGDYFEVEDGKINLQDAFVRGTRDALLQQSNASRGKSLKLWRDAIISDLSDKNKITKTKQYTRFIDEAAENKSEDRFSQWQKNIDQFISGLYQLRDTNQITEQNILKLLQPATIPDAPTSPGALGGALLAQDLMPSFAAQALPEATSSPSEALTKDDLGRIAETLESRRDDIDRATQAEDFERVIQLLEDLPLQKLSRQLMGTQDQEILERLWWIIPTWTGALKWRYETSNFSPRSLAELQPLIDSQKDYDFDQRMEPGGGRSDVLDIAAVLASPNKPAAIANLDQEGENLKNLRGLIEIARSRPDEFTVRITPPTNKVGSSAVVVSRNKATPQKMIDLFNEYQGRMPDANYHNKLGELLGYPKEAIDKFIQGTDTTSAPRAEQRAKDSDSNQDLTSTSRAELRSAESRVQRVTARDAAKPFKIIEQKDDSLGSKDALRFERGSEAGIEFVRVTASNGALKFVFYIPPDDYYSLEMTPEVTAEKNALSVLSQISNFQKAIERFYEMGGSLPTDSTVEVYFGKALATGGFPHASTSNGLRIYASTVPYRYRDAEDEARAHGTMAHELGHLLSSLMVKKVLSVSPRGSAIEEGIANYIGGLITPSRDGKPGTYSHNFKYHVPMSALDRMERMEGFLQLDIENDLNTDLSPLQANRLYWGLSHHMFGDYFIDAFQEEFSFEKFWDFVEALSQEFVDTEEEFQRQFKENGTKQFGSEFVPAILKRLGYSKERIDSFKKKLHDKLKQNLFSPTGQAAANKDDPGISSLTYNKNTMEQLFEGLLEDPKLTPEFFSEELENPSGNLLHYLATYGAPISSPFMIEMMKRHFERLYYGGILVGPTSQAEAEFVAGQRESLLKRIQVKEETTLQFGMEGILEILKGLSLTELIKTINSLLDFYDDSTAKQLLKSEDAWSEDFVEDLLAIKKTLLQGKQDVANVRKNRLQKIQKNLSNIINAIPGKIEYVLLPNLGQEWSEELRGIKTRFKVAVAQASSEKGIDNIVARFRKELADYQTALTKEVNRLAGFLTQPKHVGGAKALDEAMKNLQFDFKWKPIDLGSSFSESGIFSHLVFRLKNESLDRSMNRHGAKAKKENSLGGPQQQQPSQPSPPAAEQPAPKGVTSSAPSVGNITRALEDYYLSGGAAVNIETLKERFASNHFGFIKLENLPPLGLASERPTNDPNPNENAPLRSELRVAPLKTLSDAELWKDSSEFDALMNASEVIKQYVNNIESTEEKELTKTFVKSEEFVHWFLYGHLIEDAGIPIPPTLGLSAGDSLEALKFLFYLDELKFRIIAATDSEHLLNVNFKFASNKTKSPKDSGEISALYKNETTMFREILGGKQRYQSRFEGKLPALAILTHNRDRIIDTITEYAENLITFNHKDVVLYIFDDSNDNKSDLSKRQSNIKTKIEHYKDQGLSIRYFGPRQREERIEKYKAKIQEKSSKKQLSEADLDHRVQSALGLSGGIGSNRNWALLELGDRPFAMVDDDVYPNVSFEYFSVKSNQDVDVVSILNRGLSKPGVQSVSFDYAQVSDERASHVVSQFTEKEGEQVTLVPKTKTITDTRQLTSRSRPYADSQGGILAIQGRDDQHGLFTTPPTTPTAKNYLRMEDLLIGSIQRNLTHSSQDYIQLNIMGKKIKITQPFFIQLLIFLQRGINIFLQHYLQITKPIKKYIFQPRLWTRIRNDSMARDVTYVPAVKVDHHRDAQGRSIKDVKQGVIHEEIGILFLVPIVRLIFQQTVKSYLEEGRDLTNEERSKVFEAVGQKLETTADSLQSSGLRFAAKELGLHKTYIKEFLQIMKRQKYFKNNEDALKYATSILGDELRAYSETLQIWPDLVEAHKEIIKKKNDSRVRSEQRVDSRETMTDREKPVARPLAEIKSVSTGPATPAEIARVSDVVVAALNPENPVEISDEERKQIAKLAINNFEALVEALQDKIKEKLTQVQLAGGNNVLEGALEMAKHILASIADANTKNFGGEITGAISFEDATGFGSFFEVLFKAIIESKNHAEIISNDGSYAVMVKNINRDTRQSINLKKARPNNWTNGNVVTSNDVGAGIAVALDKTENAKGLNEVFQGVLFQSEATENPDQIYANQALFAAMYLKFLVFMNSEERKEGLTNYLNGVPLIERKQKQAEYLRDTFAALLVKELGKYYPNIGKAITKGDLGLITFEGSVLANIIATYQAAMEMKKSA